jgi:Uma2 family endonuclease
MVAMDPWIERAGLDGGPQANVGEADDYRVADLVLTAGEPDDLYLPTAALVVEVLSPGDESRLKFGHYAAHHVDEFVIIDPDTKQVEWYRLVDDRYELTTHSDVLGVDTVTVVDAMRW